MHRLTYRTPFFSSLGTLAAGALLVGLGVYALQPDTGFRVRNFVIPEWVVITGGIIFVGLGAILVVSFIRSLVAGKREVIIDQDSITIPKSDGSRKTVTIPRDQLVGLHEQPDDDDIEVVIRHSGGDVRLQRKAFKNLDEYALFVNSVRSMSGAAEQDGYPTA